MFALRQFGGHCRQLDEAAVAQLVFMVSGGSLEVTLAPFAFRRQHLSPLIVFR
jgi:hypothetical protein